MDAADRVVAPPGGVASSHARPYHPQILGKEERFHRTLKAALLSRRTVPDLPEGQRYFDRWRMIYNLERPHEALGMDVPAQHYQPSQRPFPQTLPPIEYAPGDAVRKVQAQGEICFRGHVFRITKALRGYPVALRPTPDDGVYSVHFCQIHVAEIDLRGAPTNEVNMCYLCPRTPVTLDSGPYTPAGRGN